MPNAVGSAGTVSGARRGGGAAGGAAISCDELLHAISEALAGNSRHNGMEMLIYVLVVLMVLFPAAFKVPGE